MTYEEKKRLVLDYLSRPGNKGGPVSPTKIGLDVFGKDPFTASSYVSPVCKRMVAEGLLDRDSAGRYSRKF